MQSHDILEKKHNLGEDSQSITIKKLSNLSLFMQEIETLFSGSETIQKIMMARLYGVLCTLIFSDESRRIEYLLKALEYFNAIPKDEKRSFYALTKEMLVQIAISMSAPIKTKPTAGPGDAISIDTKESESVTPLSEKKDSSTDADKAGYFFEIGAQQAALKTKEGYEGAASAFIKTLYYLDRYASVMPEKTTQEKFLQLLMNVLNFHMDIALKLQSLQNDPELESKKYLLFSLMTGANEDLLVSYVEKYPLAITDLPYQVFEKKVHIALNHFVKGHPLYQDFLEDLKDRLVKIEKGLSPRLINLLKTLAEKVHAAKEESFILTEITELQTLISKTKNFIEDQKKAAANETNPDHILTQLQNAQHLLKLTEGSYGKTPEFIHLKLELLIATEAMKIKLGRKEFKDSEMFMEQLGISFPIFLGAKDKDDKLMSFLKIMAEQLVLPLFSKQNAVLENFANFLSHYINNPFAQKYKVTKQAWVKENIDTLKGLLERVNAAKTLPVKLKPVVEANEHKVALPEKKKKKKHPPSEERRRRKAERLEQERIQNEERARKDAERIEQEKKAQAERERIEQEKKAQAERERIEQEKKAQAERERIELEKRAQAERERIELEKRAQAERERIEREKKKSTEQKRGEKQKNIRNVTIAPTADSNHKPIRNQSAKPGRKRLRNRRRGTQHAEPKPQETAAIIPINEDKSRPILPTPLVQKKEEPKPAPVSHPSPFLISNPVLEHGENAPGLLRQVAPNASIGGLPAKNNEMTTPPTTDPTTSKNNILSTQAVVLRSLLRPNAAEFNLPTVDEKQTSPQIPSLMQEIAASQPFIGTPTPPTVQTSQMFLPPTAIPAAQHLPQTGYASVPRMPMQHFNPPPMPIPAQTMTPAPQYTAAPMAQLYPVHKVQPMMNGGLPSYPPIPAAAYGAGYLPQAPFYANPISAHQHQIDQQIATLTQTITTINQTIENLMHQQARMFQPVQQPAQYYQPPQFGYGRGRGRR